MIQQKYAQRKNTHSKKTRVWRPICFEARNLCRIGSHSTNFIYSFCLVLNRQMMSLFSYMFNNSQWIDHFIRKLNNQSRFFNQLLIMMILSKSTKVNINLHGICYFIIYLCVLLCCDLAGCNITIVLLQLGCKYGEAVSVSADAIMIDGETGTVAEESTVRAVCFLLAEAIIPAINVSRFRLMAVPILGVGRRFFN